MHNPVLRKLQIELNDQIPNLLAALIQSFFSNPNFYGLVIESKSNRLPKIPIKSQIAVYN